MCTLGGLPTTPYIPGEDLPGSYTATEFVASSLDDSTVECGVFGPIGASLTKARLRHLATVLWFSPCRAASSLSGP